MENGDKEEAMERIKQAADKRHTKAMLLYSDMLEDDENNKEESIKYVKQAASKGDIDGMLKFGRILKDGIGVPIDYNSSLRYLKRAADKGQNEAKYLYFGKWSMKDSALHRMQKKAPSISRVPLTS